MSTSSTHVRLEAVQHNVDDIRNLTLCKVCLRPFYEPFILICGHTFCYGCLRSWFCGDPNKRVKKKNCPECRTMIRTKPVPNYSMRDLAHMFLDRPELLPEDETAAEHAKGKLEEALLLSTDRQGEGLFKGIFDTPDELYGRRAIHDVDDGVDRCPRCSWEIEEGRCMACGWSDPEQDFSDMEADSDLDVDSDGIPIDGAEDQRMNFLWPGGRHGPNPLYGLIRPDFGDTSVDDDDEFGTPRPYGDDFDDFDDDDMGEFISDDEDHPNEIDYDTHRWARERQARASYPVAYNDANRFPEATSEYSDTTHGDENQQQWSDSTDEDEETIARGSRRIRRVLSNEEEEEGDGEDEDDESIIAGVRNTMNSADDQVYASQNTISAEDDDQHTNYDESDSEIQSLTPVLTHQQIPKRRAHIVISDDEDEEEDEDQGGGEDADENESDSDGYDYETPSNMRDGVEEEMQTEHIYSSGSDSDDSSPPQPAARRMQRLSAHQAARVRRSTSNEQRPNHSVHNHGQVHRTGLSSTASRPSGRPLGSAARVY